MANTDPPASDNRSSEALAVSNAFELRDQFRQIIIEAISDREFQQTIDNAFRAVRHITEWCNQVAEAAAAWVVANEDGVKSLLAGFANIAKLPEQMYLAQQALAITGWYIDPKMGINEVFDLGKLCGSKQYGEIDALLIAHFSENRFDIKRNLVDRHPTRADILESGFRVHEAKEYWASVPLFLAQADGIAMSVAGASLYTERNGKAAIAPFIESRSALLFSSPRLFLDRLPISASKSARGDSWTGLNRHLVLHGESLDYGTLINSCKAISWLNFVSFVFYDEINEQSPTDGNS